MLAAAIGQKPSSIVKESSRNDPETDTALPHRILLSPLRNFLRDRGCRASKRPAGNGGVDIRIWYARILCVPPVVCRAGSSLRGRRRFRFSRFSKVASPRLSLHACAHCVPSRSATFCAAAILCSATVFCPALGPAGRVLPASRVWSAHRALPTGRAPRARGAQRGADAVAAVCGYASERDAV